MLSLLPAAAVAGVDLGLLCLPLPVPTEHGAQGMHNGGAEERPNRLVVGVILQVREAVPGGGGGKKAGIQYCENMKRKGVRLP